MTTAKHTYTVTGAGHVLGLREGDITFDVGRAPHIESTLRIAMPTADILAALDPRLTRRVLIAAASTFSTIPAQTRTFDLGLRTRRVAQDGRTVTLTLASDEALLDDYAPLSDDTGAFAHQSSLRAVINYVLGKALGAALETSPAHDEDVTVLTDATNLSPNGGFRSTTAGWVGGASAALVRTAGGPPGAGVDFFGRAAMGGLNGGGVFNIGGESAGSTAVTVGAGRQYRTTLWVRSSAAVTVSLNIEWVTAAGAGVGATTGTPVSLTANVWKRVEVVGIAPATATRAGTYCYRTAGTWPAGATFDAAAHRFSEVDNVLDDLPFLFFDGDTTDTVQYGYGWSGVASASAATRKALISRSPDMLRWQAGRSALDFLRPIVQAYGYRLVCDEHRKWTLRDENYNPGGALNLRQGVNLRDVEDTLTRDSDTWFDAAVTIYTWKDSDGVEHTEVDSFAAVDPPTQVRVFERPGVPYPGPGFSAYAVRRAQGRGRMLSAETGIDWRAQPEQFLSARVDGAPILAGTIQALGYDLKTGDMSITTRTADIPPSAWVLIPAGETWLDSPVGESWKEEII
ncbi:hypothetical protein [Microbacterium sp. TPU 3598]|uniref:hypothetical protein n=1 Tax=Microbacterium sp. TPU 3598 TaxID=1938334 RepID=UPI000BBA65D7|nr:hypothetical protein [Microbacterium sp. TPU 3598]